MRSEGGEETWKGKKKIQEMLDENMRIEEYESTAKTGDESTKGFNR